MRYGLDRAAANVPLGSITCCPGGNNLAGWPMGFPSASSSAEGLNWTAPRQNRIGAYFQGDTDFYNPEKRFFMPRLGLAYRATDKRVIRTGAGWFVNVHQMTYTYSKSLGAGYGRNNPTGGINAVYQNPRDRRDNRARYGFDATHNAVANFVCELPFFKTSKGFLKRQVMGGWQLSGIITLRTGFPFSVTGGTLNTGSTSYPDRVADGRLGGDATRQLWLDPTAFHRTECNSRPIQSCAITIMPPRTP